MTWQEVADRIFVRRYAFFDQSIAAVIGREGAIIVDTRTTDAQAAELEADLRSLTDVPLAAVVNTHHHYDHSFGNARFAAAPIWGHARCAEVLRTRGETMRADVMRSLPALAGEIARVVITPPDRTFDETASIDLGDRRIELRYLGRGHTDNDIVVLVPDSGTLLAGDLLENDAPPSFGDAYPIAWAGTLRDRLLPLVTEVVVPGHGRPAGRAFAERQAAELAELARLIRAMASGAIGPDEVRAASPYPADTTRVALERGLDEVRGSAGG
jgi:glyoxylase-like metal-dependent hydrolase (beta-lactamase superfamily II)